ncbi:hypothetical protein GCM10010498_23370 [Streptomyces cavourensis]|nr:hypothetical protein GCM10010498_23370 [Streptomyces cavourensis]
MPLLSSQASSLGSRAVIELTFQVAMRMTPNLAAPTDSRRKPAARRRTAGREARKKGRKGPGGYRCPALTAP